MLVPSTPRIDANTSVCTNPLNLEITGQSSQFSPVHFLSSPPTSTLTAIMASIVAAAEACRRDVFTTITDKGYAPTLAELMRAGEAECAPAPAIGIGEGMPPPLPDRLRQIKSDAMTRAILEAHADKNHDASACDKCDFFRDQILKLCWEGKTYNQICEAIGFMTNEPPASIAHIDTQVMFLHGRWFLHLNLALLQSTGNLRVDRAEVAKDSASASVEDPVDDLADRMGFVVLEGKTVSEILGSMSISD
jgi:hypothetical protein